MFQTPETALLLNCTQFPFLSFLLLVFFSLIFTLSAICLFSGIHYNIKMTNSFTSNTACFIGARLHVSVFSDHHHAFLRISSKNAGLHIGIPSMFTVCTSVYISVI